MSYFTGLGKPVADDWLITSIWAEEPLPKGIRLGARLYLRSVQVIARRQLGKDIRYPLADFDSLLALATEKDAFGIVGGCIGLAIHLAHEEPARANRYLLKGIKSLPAFVFPDRSHPEIPDRARPEFLLFITGLATRSEEELRDWISTVEELDDQTLRNLFCSEPGEDASVTLCDHLWLQEDKKSPGSQNWDAISGQLAMLDDFARRHNLQLWRVSSVRAQIIVLSEYKKNLPDAISLAKQTLVEINSEPRCQFLIQEAIGRQLGYAKRWAEALEWLDSAASQKLNAFPLMRMQALLAASEAASHTETSRAIRYCELAVALAEDNERIPDAQVVVALGEKAIAHWQAGDRLSAYQSWEAAVGRLLAVKSGDETWKKWFVICGHISGFFSSMASTGKPPKSPAEYVAPEPGMLLRDYPQALQLYDPAREWGLAAQLAFFAIAVGRDEDAAGWAMRAVEAGRGGPQEELSSGLRLFAVCQAILDDRFGEALDMALDAGIAIATEYLRWRGSKPHDELPGMPASFAGEDHTTTSRGRSETCAAYTALVPIIFRMGTIWLSDRGYSREAARTFGTECTRLAKTAENPHLWNAAARLVAEIFSESASWQQLNEQGNEYAQKEETALYIICYAGAMLHVRPKDALRIQLGILPTLERLLEHYGLFRRIVIPFVLKYWEEKLEKCPYYFSAPTLLNERLENLPARSPGERLRRTLEEMAFPVGLTLTESDRMWLRIA